MLLQLQKHLQTELRPFQVRSHVTQKLGQISNLLRTKVTASASEATALWRYTSLLIIIIIIRYCSIVSESVVICQLTLKMPEEIDFENCRISNFKGLVTLTLDRVMRHTVVQHSLTSTYIPNFIGIGKTFCGGRMYGRTSETHFIR